MNIYVTTPIFYVNAPPHLGHAYTSLVADTYSRFQRMLGNDVFFQTGTDEHGDKIAEAAAKDGVSPQAYVDRISDMFRQSWPSLSIAHDNFIRTTDERHKKVVQDVLQKLYDQGDIVFSDYTGLYCQGCERFLTEKELVDGLCPDHLKAPEQITEQNYFFKMSKYKEWLVEHINANPDFITPQRYRNEVLSFLSEPLEDLCISRPTSRLTWGIPLPFDANYVTYVWFDALLNYVTGIGYTVNGPVAPQFDKYWPVAEHIIAKDILKPHAIYWPTMLHSMGLEPYKKLHVHGYWNVNETKMSKSIGNVVTPAEMTELYGVDTIRYFLLREMSFGLDASFSPEAIIARQNSDLANDLGNLVSRTMAMVKKFTAGRVTGQPANIRDIDRALIEAAEQMLLSFQEYMKAFAFHRALQAVWEVIGLANKYIVENAPWELAKDPDQRGRLDDVIYNLLESLRLILLPLHAVMPETALKMQNALSLDCELQFNKHGKWGGVLVPGAEVGLEASLFPRMDKEKTPEIKKAASTQKEDIAKDTMTKEQSGQDEGLVSFDDFKKIDFRVATITAAEKIPKSDRLLKLTVEAPEPRTIVAGIAEHCQPDEIVGRQVIIVANLKPAKLMGIASHGMVMAAKDGDKLVLSTVSDFIQAGSKVS